MAYARLVARTSRFAATFLVKSMLNPADCRLRADECERWAKAAINLSIRADLRDMARAWTRLAIQADMVARRGNLRVIKPATTTADHTPDLTPPPPAE
jgi:hypothetical protein